MRAPRPGTAPERTKPPSVLVVLVARDAEAWLPRTLRSLSRQTHDRIGVLAVDNGSGDGSAALLEATLGPERVIRLEENEGFAGGVARALAHPLSERADYLLLLHDDVALDPEAVAALVEAAQRIPGVGVVGPKVLDWDDPRVLMEVGQTTDRFGFPYSPLEEGEIDQGQYARVREVLFVSSCAVLVAREVFGRIGALDERFSHEHEDIDFCWRARLAGFRVVMTPRAVVQHRTATAAGLRSGAPSGRGGTLYQRERSALGAVLKNYGVTSLLWILPLSALSALGRVAALLLGRRFEDATQVVAAWGWNLAHLPGTVGRRLRAQRTRRVPDRVIRRSMAPAAMRLRRGATAALRALLPAGVERAEPAGSAPARGLRLAAEHPVAAAWIVAAVLAVVSYRNVAFASPLVGGGLMAFPDSPSGYFSELVSGTRSTGLGGTQPASPALGLLGLASFLALGSPSLLQKLLVLGLPAVAGAVCYRAVRSSTQDRVPAVVAGAVYALSSVVLWAVSEGRIPALVYLAGLPWLATKIPLAFHADRPVSPGRWIVGTAAGLAVLAAFFPAAGPAGLVVATASLLMPPRPSERAKGLLLTAAAAAVAAALVFPVVLGVVMSGGRGLADMAGRPEFASLARLSLGAAPGSWPTGWFLPAAAALSLVFVPGSPGRTAGRAAAAALASIYLAWLAAAGYLPPALSNPLAYVGVAAFHYALLIGLGLAVLVRGVRRAAFGSRQVGAVAMAGILAIGLGLQVVQVARGSWHLGGPERLPAAYPIAAQERGVGSDYRVLWLGRTTGDDFLPPGGLPDGTVSAGESSVRFGLRSPEGASDLDVGRPAAGPGYRALERVLLEVLAGQTRHGGALLAPFGVRYIVAGPRDLPPPALRALARQVDLDRVPATGLTIFRNAKAVRLASVIRGPEWSTAALSSTGERAASLPVPRSTPLARGADRYRGRVESVPSLVLVSEQEAAWTMTLEPEGRTLPPSVAFGWAVAFRPRTPGAFTLEAGGRDLRTVELGALVLMWSAALWATRRRVRRG